MSPRLASQHAYPGPFLRTAPLVPNTLTTVPFSRRVPRPKKGPVSQILGTAVFTTRIPRDLFFPTSLPRCPFPNTHTTGAFQKAPVVCMLKKQVQSAYHGTLFRTRFRKAPVVGVSVVLHAYHGTILAAKKLVPCHAHWFFRGAFSEFLDSGRQKRHRGERIEKKAPVVTALGQRAPFPQSQRHGTLFL